MATSEEMIALIDAKLADAIENPKVDYAVGKKTYKMSQYIKYLQELRAMYVNSPSTIDVSFLHVMGGVNEFGERT